MLISNVIGIKLNYLIAMLIVPASVYSFSDKKKNITLLFVITILVVIKIFIYGTYGLKPFLIALLGPLIVYKFITCINNSTFKHIELYLKIILSTGCFVVFIIVMQKLSIIPNSVGEMSFVNTAGMGLLGELDTGERPNGFFYHPYDTALCLVPLISFSLFFKGYRRYLGFLISCLIAVTLSLKILFAFVIVIFLIPNRFYDYFHSKLIVVIFIFLIPLMLYLTQLNYSEFMNAMTAGRLFIWEIMISEFFSNISFGYIMLGYDADLLGNSLFWEGDETFTTHNQYLNSFMYMGVIFTSLMLLTFHSILQQSKLLNFIIVMSMFTFALTGDLFIFLSFWIAISQVYVIDVYLQRKPLCVKEVTLSD